MTYDFKDCNAIIHLYKTLQVHTRICASTVWSPHTAIDVHPLSFDSLKVEGFDSHINTRVSNTEKNLIPKSTQT